MVCKIFDGNTSQPIWFTGTLTTIEYQREALENANTNTEVLKIMGHAAKALKQTHNNMDIEKVCLILKTI